MRFMLGILFGISFFIKCFCAENVTTTLQLRKSVDFSYAGANLFLDLIRGEPSVNVTGDILQSIIDLARDGQSIVFLNSVFYNYPGYVACLILGIIYAVFMPLIGLFFCCIRCCGKCGGSVVQMDRKRDPCRRVVYSVFLAIITTIKLAAIILAFINFHLFYEAILNPSPQVGVLPQLLESSEKFEDGVNGILEAAKNASTVDLSQQKNSFYTMFDDGLAVFQRSFVKDTKAAEFIKVNDEFQRVAARYGPNTVSTEEWRNFIATLEEFQMTLPRLNTEISDLLNTRCAADQATACRALMDTTTKKLVVNFGLDQFQKADMTRLLSEIENSQANILKLNEFNETLLGVRTDVQGKLKPILDAAWNDLSNSPETRQELVTSLEEFARRIQVELSGFRIHVKDLARGYLENVNKPIQEFCFYSMIAFLCLPLLVIFLYYLGLCFGACGDRPYDEAGLCNRGVGANLLMSGVSFTFIFAFLLMLVCMVVFLTGGLIQTEVCRYTTSSGGPAFLDTVAKTVYEVARNAQPTSASKDPNLMRFFQVRIFDLLLNKCYNESLVDAAGAENIVFLISEKSIDASMNTIWSVFQGIDLIGPLRNTAQNTRDALTKISSLQEFNFATAIAQCNQSLTRIENFDEYLKNLRSLHINALEIPVNLLEKETVQLRLRLDLIRNMYEELDMLNPLYEQLSQTLAVFSSELDKNVPNSIKLYIDEIRPNFLNELRLAVIATWRTIPCTNLYHASMLGVGSVCVTSLWPMNGFWVGLGVSLLLSIPALIFAVKLINLYRKTEKYSPDYQEPDYISYQGFYMRPSSNTDLSQSRKHKPPKKSKKARSNDLLSGEVY